MTYMYIPITGAVMGTACCWTALVKRWFIRILNW